MCKENEQNRSNKDGDKIAFILSDHSKRLRNEGKYIAYGIVAACWSISYSFMGFDPSCFAKASIILALIYIAIDILELLLITIKFNSYLTRYFTPKDEGGYEYITENENTRNALERKTKFIHNATFWAQILMSVILVASAICLILAVSFIEQ